MEYYSAVKNNDIIKFEGKLMDVEKIVMIKAILTQKYKNGMYSIIRDYYIRSKGEPSYN